MLSSNDSAEKGVQDFLTVFLGISFRNISLLLHYFSIFDGGGGNIPVSKINAKVCDLLNVYGTNIEEVSRLNDSSKNPNMGLAVAYSIAKACCDLTEKDESVEKKYKKSMANIRDAAKAQLDDDKNVCAINCVNILKASDTSTVALVNHGLTGEPWLRSGESKAYLTIKKGAQSITDEMFSRYPETFEKALLNALIVSQMFNHHKEVS